MISDEIFSVSEKHILRIELLAQIPAEINEQDVFDGTSVPMIGLRESPLNRGNSATEVCE